MEQKYRQLDGTHRGRHAAGGRTHGQGGGQTVDGHVTSQMSSVTRSRAPGSRWVVHTPRTSLRPCSVDTGTWGRCPLLVTHSTHKALETQEQVSRPLSYTDPASPYRALETQNMAQRRVPCLAPRALCAPVKCSPRVSVQMSPAP